MTIYEQKNRTPANLLVETKFVESVESVDWFIPVCLCVVVMIIGLRLLHFALLLMEARVALQRTIHRRGRGGTQRIWNFSLQQYCESSALGVRW